MMVFTFVMKGVKEGISSRVGGGGGEEEQNALITIITRKRKIKIKLYKKYKQI
jgi:hypothetical protein